MNILPGNLRFGAGKAVKRLEDQRLLTGKGNFIDDKPEDGALWLYVLRSPHAHAKIKAIDTKAAGEMNGVAAVFTGADLIRDDVGTIPTLTVFQRPDGKPMTVPPRRLLAHDIVRFAGEPVAAVAASSRVLAQSAAEAIEIAYEVLPSVVDPLDAMKPGAPLVWPEASNNIVAAMSYGDAANVEEAFAKAAHKVSLDLVSQRLVPSAMEPRSTIAEVEKKTGRLLLYVQSQTPGSTRDILADAILKRPKESVRVLVGDIGGGSARRPASIPKTASSPMPRSSSARRSAGAATAPTTLLVAPMAATSPRPASSRSTRKAACWPIACVPSAAPAPIPPGPATSFRWCSGPSCRAASTICRWCITR
jgi:carbon-monoxide dehydrogenase large subunit